MPFPAIASNTSTVFFYDACYTALNQYLKTANYSKLFILVDSNTQVNCLAHFLVQLETNLVIETIEIDAGEEHKTIETCQGVWSVLSELGADRKSLLINLGGGVVTDLGGFVAATFKRGIHYINIPTSLLAMVDASVGGKTGVDLGSLKNQVGVISQSQMVLIDTRYLDTLPANELKSGHAEILKHGLITDQKYWEKAVQLKDLTMDSYKSLIYESVEIKNSIVTKDPTEQGLRKTLNYGHTLGHAIESYLLEHSEKPAILHGEAVAVGMILATYLSHKTQGFPEEKLQEIAKALIKIYPKVSLDANDYPEIINFLKYDKKNSHGNINFILLKNFGKPVYDCQIKNSLIIAAFDFYESL